MGDRIPDGPPGTAEFVVEHVEQPRVLLLHSTTHLPVAWRARDGHSVVDWTWCFLLTPVGPEQTRVQVRVRGRVEPWWLTLASMALLPLADLIMCPGTLRGLARRVTREAARGLSRRTTPAAMPKRRPLLSAPMRFWSPTGDLGPCESSASF